ncbi:ice-binding family protein [Pontibacter indicus]|uniref:Conserved repeat domain-containing protein/gliding motility-associated C-terminal domain-containing protein n=1 Tax=Pontibacter indicus TaxID=1317125 RepID=A0A1R3XC24_9BACT|nr:ice-binding family protein [Pontibacter indicus]SIT88650.1 conserved repeat domain-containing protein/gliding motility-associated C-terminal domain-containing protein [Pontibacter indicus]
MTSFSSRALLLVLGLWLVVFGVNAQQAPTLGAFYDYNVVGGDRVFNQANTNTVVRAKAASVSRPAQNFSPGAVWRGIDNVNAAANAALAAATSVYNTAAATAPTATLTNPELGGRTYTSGVYVFNGDATVTNDITLDGNNNPNAVFIFIVKGSLNIGAGVDIELIRDAKIGNVFWVVENELTVANGAEIKGQYLAKQAVTIGDGSIVRGRVASLQGEVRLNNNNFFLPTDLEIKITKTEGNAGVDRYIVGQTITYTFTVTNKGPVDDENVRVTPILFSGANHTYTTDAPGATFSFVNGNWTWNIGSLKVGQTYTLTLTATINETGPGFVRGTISGAAEDEIQQNNTVDINFCAVLPDAGVITGAVELCVGTVGEYSIEPVVGATGYTWNVPSGWRITSGQGTTKITVEATNRNDEAFIQVSVNNSCGASPPSRLKVNNYPDPPATPGPITANEGVCAGEGATYSIEPVKDATSYIWTVPAGWKIVTGQGTTQISVTVGESGGKVTVKAKNVCGVSPNAAELEVKPYLQAPNQPSNISGSGTLPFCVTTDRVTFSVTASGDVAEYVWEYPTEWTIISGQGTNTVVFNPNGVGGTVTVKGINACGTSPSRTFNVVPVPGPPVNPGDISGAFPVCQNSVGTKYSVAPVPGATGYTWYVPDGWTITAGQGTNEITVSLSETASGGQLRVQAFNECGASGITRKDVTTATGAPSAPVAIKGVEFGCTDKTTVYEIDAVAGAQSYTWTLPPTWSIVSGQGTTRITVTIGSQSGNVSVIATNSCGQSSPATKAVRPFPTVPASPIAIKGPAEVCIGQSEAVYVLEPVDHTLEYIWAVPSGWTIISGQGTTEIKVKVGTLAGDITVTASNPCGNSVPAKLRVVPVPDVPAPQAGPITGNAQYCAGLNQTYSIAEVPGASSYFWSFPGADWVIVEGQGTTRVTVKAGATQGQVKVATVNNCGTRSTATGFTVQSVGSVPPSPAAIISGNESYCGNATGLTFRIAAVPTATSYEWVVPAGWKIESGQGTTQIKATAGTAGGEVTVVAVNSCGKSQSVKLLTEPQRPLMNPEAIKGPELACVGRTDAVYSIPAISGAETYLWKVPTGWEILEGAGTNSIKVKITGRGDVFVSAKNACGTTAESKLTVEVVTSPPLAPTAIKGETLTCASRTTTYSIDPVANASSYSWKVPTGWTITAGHGSTQITVQIGTGSGEISVEAVNDCDRSAATKLAVSARPLPVISRIVDRTLACSDIATFELESNSPGALFTWEVPAGWEILSGQGTSVITVMQGNNRGEITVVADNGECKSDPVSMVSDPGLREANLIVPNVFTPNNDGENDTWMIGNLANYPDNEVVVVNRWGNEVYKSKAYQNNWNGDKLAEGTYYYLIRLTLCDGSEKTYKGYVMIVR